MNYKSCAQWPVGCFDAIGNYSEDTHGSRDAAEHVCSLLHQRGAGGDGIFFPVKTWVEAIKEKTAAMTPIDQRAREAAQRFCFDFSIGEAERRLTFDIAKALIAQHAEDVAAGEKDKARLDWMIANSAYVSHSRDGEVCNVWYRHNPDDESDAHGAPVEGYPQKVYNTPREAIDAAMLKS